ncbi:MAG TPA: hypothetical protein VEJ84_12430 [Acidimicrobiales bacterium]|nr:hypothetical protein [Acidimicrobiales bacterium]
MSDPVVVESCHSIWVFDSEQRRFQRLLKGLTAAGQPPATGWRPYFRVDFDLGSDAFVVLLNEDGSRLLRSWRHVEPCARCSDALTAELDISELREAAGT